MNKIFKINYLKERKIEKIFVFYGRNYSPDFVERFDISKNRGEFKTDLTLLNELFREDPNNNYFKDIFSETEKREIIKNDIEVIFSEMQIYLDDTIDVIKRKIVLQMKKEIFFNEIYLYGFKISKLSVSRIFKELTQDGKLDLTKDKLFQYLLNVKNVDFTDIDLSKIRENPDNGIYTYEDLILLDIDNKDFLIKTAIGHFFKVDEKYNYTIDPFDAIVYDDFAGKCRKYRIDTKSTFTLEFGKLQMNSLYLCLANDVFIHASNNTLGNKLSVSSTSKIYYPFLYDRNIEKLSELNSEKQNLIAEDKKIIGSQFQQNIKNSSMFYDIYKYQNKEFQYLSRGIKNIDFTIYPQVSFNLPLDLVFKLINVNEQSPFMKFNPGVGKEKIFKLYADKISKTKKRIPYLTKAKILSLNKLHARSKSVVVYVVEKEKQTPVICEFKSNGTININVEFNEPVSVDFINKNIIETIKPIIFKVSDYLQQSGYDIELVDDIYNERVEIIALKYVMYFPIKKNIYLNRLTGCISTLCNVINDDIKKELLRFKRVTNYNEMDDINAMITELLMQRKNEQRLLNY